jgi:hypothetical protein
MLTSNLYLYAFSMRFSRQSAGPKLLFAALSAYSGAGTVVGDVMVTVADILLLHGAENCLSAWRENKQFFF